MKNVMPCLEFLLWVYTEPKAIQLWSYFDKNSNEEVHKYEYQRAIETINKTLGLNLTEL